MEKCSLLSRTFFTIAALVSSLCSAYADTDDRTLKNKINNFQNPKEIKLNYEVERQAAKQIIGIEIRTFNEECPKSLPRIWNRFNSEDIADKIPNRIDDKVLAVYCDYEGDHTKPFTYFLGCAVSTLENIPSGMVGKTIPEANYAKFRSKGPYPYSLISLWTKIWQSDLNRAYTIDYEVYGSNFDAQNNPSLKVFVALK